MYVSKIAGRVTNNVDHDADGKSLDHYALFNDR